MASSKTTIIRPQPVPSLHVVKAPGSRFIRDVTSVSEVPPATRKMTRELGGRVLRTRADATDREAGEVVAVGTAAAARRWAKTHGKSVYRVALDQIASKYIGETEKNLAAAFAEAEKRGAVLLLDEADAVFGKRSEVKDAHDRYANIEVNYLLQQIEEHGGIITLARNRRSNVDPAFLRRLRFVQTAPVKSKPRKRAVSET